MNKEEKTEIIKNTAAKAKEKSTDNAAEFPAGYVRSEIAGYGAENFCAASVTECTGLIQVPPEDEEEYEAYNEVYGFAPQSVVAKNEKMIDD